MPRLLFRILLAIAAAGLPAAPAPAEDYIRFTETEAARAFQAGRFSEALEELLKLKETNPENVLVLRYLAMCYDRLGRYNDALRAYIEALAIEPQNVAVLFHSGETLLRLRYAEDARRHFQLVISGAPESAYARLARQYLDSYAERDSAIKTPGGEKKFSFAAEFGFLFDNYRIDGAYGAPEQRNRSGRLTQLFSAELNVLRAPEWLGALDFSFYGAQYLSGRDSARDILQYSAGASLQHSGSLFSKPVLSSFRYQHQGVRFDGGRGYSSSDGISLAAQLSLAENAVTRLLYACTNDRFEDDGFDAEFSSRDALLHKAGLHNTLYFLDQKVWLTAAVFYQVNEAEGLNFDFEGPSFSASLSVPLPFEARLELAWDYSNELYHNFAGPVRRETDRHEFGASIYRWVGRNLLLRLRMAHVLEDSSIPGLSYDRTTAGLTAAYVF